jgi:hypothetical protein
VLAAFRQTAAVSAEERAEALRLPRVYTTKRHFDMRYFRLGWRDPDKETTLIIDIAALATHVLAKCG